MATVWQFCLSGVEIQLFQSLAKTIQRSILLLEGSPSVRACIRHFWYYTKISEGISREKVLHPVSERGRGNQVRSFVLRQFSKMFCFPFSVYNTITRSYRFAFGIQISCWLSTSITMLSKQAIEWIMVFFPVLTFFGLSCMPEHPVERGTNTGRGWADVSVIRLCLQAEKANISCCKGWSVRSLSLCLPLWSVGSSILGFWKFRGF